MTDPKPTLAEFLLARIAEDEETAHQAATKPWRLDGGFSIAVDAGSVLAAGQHMMRWHPARVLAECAAKRRIVELHREAVARSFCWTCANFDDEGEPIGNMGYPCPTLRVLALPYADHPDYREEWRP